MPKLSVVIPVYNAQKYLCGCVQSILSQDYADFELLLVDDGSTDESGAICDEYAKGDKRVRVFHKSNGGVSSARNYGLDRVAGSYLIFADADDWFGEHSFSILMEQTDLQDLTYYGSVFHYEDREVWRTPDAFFYSSPSGVQHGLFLLAYNKKYPDYIGFTWNKVFKVSIIKENGLRFIEHLSIREDEIFALHYASLCKTMLTLPNVIYHYRKHSFGLTAMKNGVEELRVLVTCFRETEDLFADESLKDYICGQAVRFLMHAVRVSYERDVRCGIIQEMCAYAYRRKHFSFPIKFWYRFLLLLPSPWFMQVFMDGRALYYRLKKGKAALI